MPDKHEPCDNTTCQIGLAYDAGGFYKVSNGYATTQNVYISTIKTRTAS